MIKIPHDIGIKCTLKSIKWSIQGWKQLYYLLEAVFAIVKAKIKAKAKTKHK